MSGQLGDIPPQAMASPKKQPAPAPAPAPAPSSTPSSAVIDSKPVVEAATPPAPKTEVVSTSIPSPDSTGSFSVSIQPPVSTSQERPQSPASGLVTHAPSEPSIEQIAEDHTYSSDADQQKLKPPVTEIPTVQQLQSTSHMATEDLSLPAECEMQNLSTYRGLDKTTVSAEVETEPNPKITQSKAAAPLTDNGKVELSPENLTEVTTDLVEPKPNLPPVVVAEGISVQPYPMTNLSTTSAKEEEITEVGLGNPTEQKQIDAYATAAECNSLDRIDAAVEKIDSTKLEVDSATSDTKNDASTKIKAETEAIVEKTELSKNLVEIVSTDPTHILCDLANKSLHVAPIEAQSKDFNQVNQENTTDNKAVENSFAEKEMEKQNIPEKAGEEIIKYATETENGKERVETVDEKAGTENKSSNEKAFEEVVIQKNAAADEVAQVNADDEKAFVEQGTVQKKIEKPNHQTPLENEGHKAGSSTTPSSSETISICLVTERHETKTAEESASTSEIGTNEPTHFEQSIVQTVLILEESKENEKPVVEAESVEQKGGKHTHTETMLNEGEKPLKSPDCKEKERENVEDPVQSVQLVIQDRNIICGGEVFHDETQVGSQNTNSIVENQTKVEMEMHALTASGENKPEKVTELSVKENEEELHKKEAESQLVAGNIQESISISEAGCGKDVTAQFDAGENPVSKMGEVSGIAFDIGGVSASVDLVPVAESEIPVFIVTEQDKSPSEKSIDMEEEREAKAQPLGKPSEAAVTEVTSVKPKECLITWLFMYKQTSQLLSLIYIFPYTLKSFGLILNLKDVYM